MPCPICIGAMISSCAQGAGLIGVARHVHDKAKERNKTGPTIKTKKQDGERNPKKK